MARRGHGPGSGILEHGMACPAMRLVDLYDMLKVFVRIVEAIIMLFRTLHRAFEPRIADNEHRADRHDEGVDVSSRAPFTRRQQLHADTTAIQDVPGPFLEPRSEHVHEWRVIRIIRRKYDAKGHALKTTLCEVRSDGLVTFEIIEPQVPDVKIRVVHRTRFERVQASTTTGLLL